MSEGTTNTSNPAVPTNAAGITNTAVGGISPTPAKAPEAPKPIKIKDREFRSEDDAYAEIERGRQSTKLLTQAEKRNHEASRKEKEFADLVSEVKTKKQAAKLIEKLGLSKEEAVEVFGKWLYEVEVAPQELSPEKRRIKELESKLAQEEETKAQAAKRQKEEQEEAETRKEEARLRQELTKVINDKKIPGTRLALRRLANYMKSYADAEAEISVDQAADMVAEDYKQEFGELFTESTPDQLAEFFGPAKWMMLAKKVSEWALARSRGSVKVPDAQVASRKSVPKEEKMNPQEFQKFLRSVK